MIQGIIAVCRRISPTKFIKENQRFIHNNRFPYTQSPLKRLAYRAPSTYLKSVYFFSSYTNNPSGPASQSTVYTLTKKHALYLTIHLQPTASTNKVSNIFCNLDKYVENVSPKELRNKDTEILAGVGFGPDFLNKLQPDSILPTMFAHYERKGLFGFMPSTGGDIFIHAKCDEISKLFEFAHILLKSLPGGTVNKFEDIYGWIYRGGRDLSGFIVGTENSKDEDHRQKVAVKEESGGSFVITQKWVHDHNLLDNVADETKESWMGRTLTDGKELEKKAATSHVARITGGSNFQQKKKFEIIRQSKPYGTLSGENGFFFLAYSAKVDALNFMLNRMVGATDDGLNDDIMRFSRCATSSFWYFPGLEELQRMKK